MTIVKLEEYAFPSNKISNIQSQVLKNNFPHIAA